MEAFEECQLVIYMQNCVSAVDHIKGTFFEHPLRGISHLKLDLGYNTLTFFFINKMTLADELIV